MITRARAKQAASFAPWAELLPEVTQRIAGLLDDDDRQARVLGSGAGTVKVSLGHRRQRRLPQSAGGPLLPVVRALLGSVALVEM